MPYYFLDLRIALLFAQQNYKNLQWFLINFLKTLQPIFITIDPERDTAESMASYVPQFHPDIIGLTGSVDQIQSVLDGWKVYAAKVNDPQLSDYTMDHSTYSYLVNKDMEIKALFRLKTSADEIVKTVRAIINE
jgi:cytochrome oxidase Cu insertion factor (SCO1/SenC/PrrC family)